MWRRKAHAFVSEKVGRYTLTVDPLCDELLVLCDKILHVWISSRKPRVSKPRGRQMPDPRAVPNLLMPLPRDWQGAQMPRSCQGGGMGAAGIDWCITLTCIHRRQGKYSPIFTKPEVNNCFSIILRRGHQKVKKRAKTWKKKHTKKSNLA